VGGDVADGMAYESKTSILVRVMLAMTGWRRELALMVLKLNFLSSTIGDDVEALAEMPDVRRDTAFGTQRDLSDKPCSSVQPNS